MSNSNGAMEVLVAEGFSGMMNSVPGKEGQDRSDRLTDVWTKHSAFPNECHS